jgi:hypothetical protein
VNDTADGWSVHPDAEEVRATLPPARGPRRVVGVGAFCDLRSQHPNHPFSQSFSVSEFVTLDDGRRLILHEARGFTIGWGSTAARGSADVSAGETRESLTRSVLNAVLPDDDEVVDEHPWSWLASLAQARGLDVTTESMRTLPYEVTLSDRAEQWLSRQDRDPDGMTWGRGRA